jgi:hypothetical protein
MGACSRVPRRTIRRLIAQRMTSLSSRDAHTWLRRRIIRRRATFSSHLKVRSEHFRKIIFDDRAEQVTIENDSATKFPIGADAGTSAECHWNTALTYPARGW